MGYTVIIVTPLIPIGSIVVPFWGYIPYRIPNMNPKTELVWGLWV